ncbi:MAG: hypothetical protein K0R18_213 [Bacillales bacterium]|jgi:hypothetical protein|nr:hypothetical protein [Bacillales bacterium]
MKSVDEIFELLDSYIVGMTLFDTNIESSIKAMDYDIYDAWDYDNPPCYSVLMVNRKERSTFKFSKNMRDNELVWEVRDFGEKHKTLLESVYNDFKNANRQKSGIHVNWNINSDGSFRFCGYFIGRGDYVLNIMKQYVSNGGKAQ